MYVYCNLISTTVISEPDDVTICKEESATFDCVLDSSISSDDVQWYRLLKDSSTTEIVDPVDDHITVSTPTGNTLTTILTINNPIKSYTGYYWVRLLSGDVCNMYLSLYLIQKVAM